MTTEYLGIDVSKAKLDVALLNGEQTYHKIFGNTLKGFNALHKWLKRIQVSQLHACMEASGSYWEKIAQYLYQMGYKVSVVNPARTNAFARSELIRTKTDRVDAGVIARFCRAHQPYPWKPLPPHKRELRNLTRRLQALKAIRRQELNRLKDSEISEAEKHSLNRILEVLKEEIRRIKKQIQEHIGRDLEIKEEVRLLKSIPGISDTTAALLLSEMGELSNYRSARQLAAYAGLTPRHRQSGSSIHGKTRLVKIGNSRLRTALYMPAIVAKARNPVVRRFYQRLLNSGKAKMVALGAAMRKLLHIVYGVLKHKEVFNANYLPTRP